MAASAVVEFSVARVRERSNEPASERACLLGRLGAFGAKCLGAWAP